VTGNREQRAQREENPGARLVTIASAPPEGAEEGLSLHEIAGILWEGRFSIAAAIAIGFVLGSIYLFVKTPIFGADALVQVEDKNGRGGLLGDLEGLIAPASSAGAEIEVLGSRTLLGKVVDELQLDVVAQPRRFPLLGSALARGHEEEEPASAFLGLGRFAWGGEAITVSRLEVPAVLLDEWLTLTALEGGRFTVRDPRGTSADGEVGHALDVPGGISLFVAELRARPGTEFRLMRQHRSGVVDELQRAISIKEKGKQTGVISLNLSGPNARRIADVLNALAQAYVRQNVERKSAEARKTLEFLETQLPLLRTGVDAAERELERYHSANGRIDLTIETQAIVTRATEIEKAASELQVEEAALRERFTTSHPAIGAIEQKLARLAAERTAVEARLKKLPEAQLESARRMRDVKVANELYLSLLNRAQELKVMKEGTIGSVRILDAAVAPLEADAPRRAQVLVLALLLGGLGGVGLVYLRRALDHGVEDPDAVERTMGVPVYATVPHSDLQLQAVRRATRADGVVPVLAESAPRELAVEALRSLRTSLEFGLVESRNNVVNVTGPAPGVGKSFVCRNLAYLLGEAGRRVVLVDADMRRGVLHRTYGVERNPGLSDVLSGAVPLADALRDVHGGTVHFLPSGTLPPNPAELLGSERFAKMLEELSARFDLVLVDTPPVLAVTDGALVARRAGVNLVVLRAGKHPIREIEASLRQLARNGVQIQGFVMNDVRVDSATGRSAYHYQYKYE
jgi:tyrosine-protein kinase Etk/Wzc